VLLQVDSGSALLEAAMSQPRTYYTAHQLELMGKIDVVSEALFILAAVAVWFGAMGFEMARAQGF
jgi:hypothetical protein